ncbi:TIGR03000 domain-containing protein [Planctomycetes bacterium CA13]|uniref:TIGR03000 domain-containing protein n=1 Tax=Novipirellula herctigrandis TaxID=2527986 RepID=UPI0011B4497F
MTKYFKFLTIASAIILFASVPDPVFAGGSYGGSYGSSVSYSCTGGGSSGGYTAYSSGSSGGRVGPLRRLFAAIRSRRAARHRSSGSSGGSRGGVSYASYNSGGCSGGNVSNASYSSYGSSGGSGMSFNSYVVPTVDSYPMSYESQSYGLDTGYESPIIESSYQPYSAPLDSVPMGDTIIDGGYDSGVIQDSGPSVIADPVFNDSASIEGETIDNSNRYESAKPKLDVDAALLTVAVPEHAVVTVNGHATTSDGNVRQFMSRGLQEGYVYTYVVNVDYDFNGENKSESKSIKLRPGDVEQVVFETPQQTEEQPKTSDNQPETSDVVTVVKLHVPKGAEVTLAGNPTKGQGSIRTFRTTQLKVGEQWTDYTIRVTAVVNGQAVSKERTVNVAAGSNTELTFEFEESSFAQR